RLGAGEHPSRADEFRRVGTLDKDVAGNEPEILDSSRVDLDSLRVLFGELPLRNCGEREYAYIAIGGRLRRQPVSQGLAQQPSQLGRFAGERRIDQPPPKRFGTACSQDELTLGSVDAREILFDRGDDALLLGAWRNTNRAPFKIRATKAG